MLKMPKIIKNTEELQKRKRIRIGPPKKWSETEELAMIYYILDKQNENKPFEKPTAVIYYEKMINRLEWNIKWQQAKAKMQNMRAKYLLVKKWLDGTGQGVDNGSVEDFKTSKCPHYDMLHFIYGTKANITIPYQYDSLLQGEDDEGRPEARQDVGNEDRSKANDDIEAGNVILIEETDEESCLPWTELEELDSHSEKSFHTQSQGDLQEKQIDLPEEDSGSQERHSNVQDTESEEEIRDQNDTRLARFKKQLLERSVGQQFKPNKREIPSNAAAFISDANLKRAETLHERNQIELKRVENENIEMEISKKRFDLEKVMHMERLTLSKKELHLRDQEFSLKENEEHEKFELRKKDFELKCKKLSLKEKQKEYEFKLKTLELAKAERLEKLKIECEFKLQLEIAKLKQ